MNPKSLEQIVEDAERFQGKANTAAINKDFRAHDQSNLWPICGRFNATERAIRRARRFMGDYGAIFGLEYALFLESEISRIVNSAE